jgi:hypothetical protein
MNAQLEIEEMNISLDSTNDMVVTQNEARKKNEYSKS